MCSNLSQTYCQKRNFLSISGEVNFQPACLSYSHQHWTTYNHTHFFSNLVLSMPVMLLCTCGTGHCSDWLDAVYWVPASTSVWTVQHGAGPPSRCYLLFTQPYCLGPCPVLGRNCMFHRIWRSVLQMHCATYTLSEYTEHQQQWSLLFWDVMEYQLVVWYWHLVTAYGSNFQETRSPMDYEPTPSNFLLLPLYSAPVLAGNVNQPKALVASKIYH